MAVVALKTYFLVFASLAQALGYFPSTTSTPLTPREGPKVQIPRQTQPQGALSISQSTSPLVESQLVTPSPTSIGNVTFTIPPACEVVNSLLSVCNSISPGFTTFMYEDQTSCLCYPNTTKWQPEIFDGAVATCAQYLSATPSEYSQIASLEGFCTQSIAGCNASAKGSCTPTSLPVIVISTPGSSAPTRTYSPTVIPTLGSSAPTSTQSSNTGGGGTGIWTVTNADFTPGQKAGIGVGSFAAASLAGYGLFVAFRIKKPAEVNDGGEESGIIRSPEDGTTTTGAEKALALSGCAEIHEIQLVVPRAMTFYAFIRGERREPDRG